MVADGAIDVEKGLLYSNGKMINRRLKCWTCGRNGHLLKLCLKRIHSENKQSMKENWRMRGTEEQVQADPANEQVLDNPIDTPRLILSKKSTMSDFQIEGSEMPYNHWYWIRKDIGKEWYSWTARVAKVEVTLTWNNWTPYRSEGSNGCETSAQWGGDLPNVCGWHRGYLYPRYELPDVTSV